jgi:uncharacterized membrane protein
MARIPFPARAAMLGWATGGRNATGPAALALTSSGARTAVRAASAAAAAGELVVDKLPATPSRVAPAPLAARVLTGAVVAAVLARREGRPYASAAALGGVAAAAGSVAGWAWRTWTAKAVPPWSGAVAEDALVLTLAALATTATD